MKPTDNDIKKALEQLNIPDPSENVKNDAIQRATEEFVKKNPQVENKTKGFSGFLRQTGKTVQKILTVQGGPIMTQKQFATLGILVIAVGLIVSIGPQMFHTSPIESDRTSQLSGKTPDVDNEIREQLPEAEHAPETAKPSLPEETILAQDAVQPQVPAETRGRQDSPAHLLKEEKVASTLNVPASPKRKVVGKAVTREMSAGRSPAPGFYYSEEDVAVPMPGYYKDEGRDKFDEITFNPIKLVGEEPVSTFSIDVDTASYAFVRRQLNNGILPQKDAVRVEELINYFNYSYPLPEDRSKPFKPTVAIYPTPWNENTKLLHIGIKGYDIIPAEKPRSNLVFLIDVSGSMNSPDKLPLLRNSFSLLVDTLDPEDTVAIAVYSGAAGTILEPTKVKEKDKILAALHRLHAGGSTAGGAGIQLAYSLAEMHFDKEAVNRVILATDGDFNVGITNQNELKSYIERKRKTGIFLSVLGFGQGNYNDALMQALAQNGNGNAAYIDSLNEARKVLVDEAGGTLFTIAKDVKIQIEFNPATVHDYRLIGYESRMLRQEDFNNDKVDAGDIGSGHSVTALYEITPVESRKKQLIDDLRYQTKEAVQPKTDAANEYAFLKIRYKLPDEDTSRLIRQPVSTEQESSSIADTPIDMQFAAAVAAFGQILRNDPYTGEFAYDDIIKIAEPARGRDQYGYRSEFLNLVRLAKTAKGM